MLHDPSNITDWMRTCQVFTSDHALKLEWVPDWIAIIGSGYIGLEFSDVYTALGSEVTFIEVCQATAGMSPFIAWRYTSSSGATSLTSLQSAPLLGHVGACMPRLKWLHPLNGLQAVDNLMPGFDKEIARTAQRLLINPRRIDYHTGVLATKVTPGVELCADLLCTRVTAAHVVDILPEDDDLPSPSF